MESWHDGMIHSRDLCTYLTNIPTSLCHMDTHLFMSYTFIYILNHFTWATSVYLHSCGYLPVLRY